MAYILRRRGLMTNINLERRAEIGREKRARTKAQLIAAARALCSRRPWESVTVDEVVNEAGVAKGTFYTHFDDLNQLAGAVADELIQSFDELLQPIRLSISDPVLRIAFGCDAFIEKALEDRLWASLAARMARSYPAVGQVAQKHLSEDLRQLLEQSPQAELSLELALEVSVGIVSQVMAAIGDGRLKDPDPTEVVRCILTAIGIGKRDAASICARLAGLRRARSARRPVNDKALNKPTAPLRQANAERS
jgi:AcrR family transcriptional regulator